MWLVMCLVVWVWCDLVISLSWSCGVIRVVLVRWLVWVVLIRIFRRLVLCLRVVCWVWCCGCWSVRSCVVLVWIMVC